MNYPLNFNPKRHTMADVRAALDAVTETAASFIVTGAGHESIQLWIGDPRPGHAQVKHFKGADVGKWQYDSIDAATAHFLELCSTVLK